MPFDLSTAKPVQLGQSIQQVNQGFDLSTAKPVQSQTVPPVPQSQGWQSPEIISGNNVKEGFGARLQRELEAIPRNLGLTARYAVEGPAEVVGIFTDPITYAINKFGGNIPTVGESVSQLATQAGLPEPQTEQEKIVASGAKLMAGVAPIIGGSRAAASGLTGAAKGVSESLSTAPTAQVVGAGTGGTAGEYMKQTGGGTGAQLVGALGGSIAGATAVSSIGRLVNSLRVNAKSATDLFNKLLSQTGVKASSIPVSIRKTIIKDLDKALRTGDELDPAVLKRMAEYAAIGARPTRGTVTLDPATITREKNLQKLAAQSNDPTLTSYAAIPRQNEQVLVTQLDEMGAGRAVRPIHAAEAQQQALRAVDAPRKSAVDTAYQSVRDSAGRYANIDTQKFSQIANDALDEGALGAVLPKEAKKILNGISSGDIPLNVNTMMQIDETLSGLQRDAGMKTKAALAIGKVRDALRQSPIESEAGEAAVRQYERARLLARDRFKKIENNPAMKAALDNDDPDKFFNTFILGSGKKASVKNVNALAKDLSNDPMAFQSARDQILAYIKNKALNGQPDDVATFSRTAYMKTLDGLKDKLPSFFTKDEIKLLETIGNVASYEKFIPTGSAVNTSNTASAFTAILEKVASNQFIGKIPFGEQVIREPVKNWLNQRTANESMRNILTSRGTKQVSMPTYLIPSTMVLSTNNAQ